MGQLRPPLADSAQTSKFCVATVIAPNLAVTIILAPWLTVVARSPPAITVSTLVVIFGGKGLKLSFFTVMVLGELGQNWKSTVPEGSPAGTETEVAANKAQTVKSAV